MKLHNLFPALGVLLVTLGSCTAGTDGIFATIESEKKVEHTGNLSTTSTVTHMTEFNGKYYATGGRALFSRDTSSTTWSATTSINGTSPYYFEAVGSTGNLSSGGAKLYAIANTGDSSTDALYFSADGSTWTKVDLGTYRPAGLVPVRNNDGQTSEEIVVTASTCDTVWLFTSSTDPSTSQSATGVLLASSAAGANPITAAAKAAASGSTGEYYLANESFVYYLDASFANVAKVTTLPSSPKGYQGLLVLGTANGGVPAGIYLTTRSNSTTGGSVLYGTVSGATVTISSTLKSNYQLSSYPVTFNQMLVAGSGLWVGTGPGTTTAGYEGYGYFNYTSGTWTYDPPSGADSAYTSADLNTYAIPLLYKAPTSGDYFIGTASHGLWRLNGTTWEQQ
jgi:hypothetical protein